jgi:hypothetical protein
MSTYVKKKKRYLTLEALAAGIAAAPRCSVGFLRSWTRSIAKSPVPIFYRELPKAFI